MGLNIKNEETHRLAARLAELTGETMTGAVTKAIQERLDRLQKNTDSDHLYERARELIKLSGGYEPYADHGELYGELGLPD